MNPYLNPQHAAIGAALVFPATLFGRIARRLTATALRHFAPAAARELGADLAQRLAFPKAPRDIRTAVDRLAAREDMLATKAGCAREEMQDAWNQVAFS